MSSPIPFIYRLTFTILEPLLALGGVLQIFFFPQEYLRIAHPNLHTALALSSTVGAVTIREQVHALYAIISGGWSIVVFNDLVTLRVFDTNPDVWACVLAAHLCSDMFYFYAVGYDVGWEIVLNPTVWTANDWITTGTTIPPLLLKIAYLCTWWRQRAGEKRAGLKVHAK